MAAARVDLAPEHGQPPVLWVVVATLASVGASLLADAGLVALGTTVFPSTVGYSHFRFSDYATLTVIGVLVACLAWPVVTRVSSSPRWLFLRLAVVVTLVLWLPDLWILLRGEPADAVGVLMVMHLAIALLTYNLLVRAAPVRGRPSGAATGEQAGVGQRDTLGAPAPRRPEGLAPWRQAAMSSPPMATQGWVWIAMLGAVGLEFIVGMAALVVFPTGRPSGWIPVEGRVVYLIHAAAGGLVGLAALALVAASVGAGRLFFVSAAVGAVGMALAAGGGVLSVDHATRIVGMGLMAVGGLVSLVAYVVPVIESLPDPVPGQPGRPMARPGPVTPTVARSAPPAGLAGSPLVDGPDEAPGEVGWSDSCDLSRDGQRS
jgi:hypothetical protein